jgi:prepilin-type N-terminal cleavage/methylation domain-containing protein
MKHRRREGFTLIELMIVVVIVGLLAAVATPNLRNFQDRSRDATVKSNCHTVQLAAEDFAIQNQGVYAASPADAGASGFSIIDLLPGGQPLENPWTMANTEPITGAANNIGQTGYRPVQANGVNVGYIIDGQGQSQLVLSLTNG